MDPRTSFALGHRLESPAAHGHGHGHGDDRWLACHTRTAIDPERRFVISMDRAPVAGSRWRERLADLLVRTAGVLASADEGRSPV